MTSKKDKQWDLALAFLKRSDEAATVLRSLLFALSSGSIGFVFTQLQKGSSGLVISGHVLSIVFFAVAIGLLIKSWQLQKYKAYQRYELLRDNDLKDYLDFNKRQPKERKNYKIDRSAVWFITLGAVAELGTKICTTI